MEGWKTSKEILRSEASTRFEKGLDPNRTYIAINRACTLLEKYADAEIVGGIAVYDNENKPLEEYNKTNKIIQDALGDSSYQSNLFRFPGGSVGGYYDKLKQKAKKKFREKGISSLDWNCLTNDSDGAETKQAIMQNLKATSKGKKSLVILMHDAPNKDLTAKTLPDVIKYLKKQGYHFKNMYDVIE